VHKRPDVFTVAGSMKNSRTQSASWLLRANVRNCSNEELSFLAKRALAAKPNDKFSKLDISEKASNPSAGASAAQADVLECRRSGRLRQNIQEAEADILDDEKDQNAGGQSGAFARQSRRCQDGPSIA